MTRINELDPNDVFAAIQSMLTGKGIPSQSGGGLERKLDKAWCFVELKCCDAELRWRSDRPRNFTVYPRTGRGRTFRVCKDDTVNVRGIVEAMLSSSLLSKES